MFFGVGGGGQEEEDAARRMARKNGRTIGRASSPGI
jgi:hypothetical protein